MWKKLLEEWKTENTSQVCWVGVNAGWRVEVPPGVRLHSACLSASPAGQPCHQHFYVLTSCNSCLSMSLQHAGGSAWVSMGTSLHSCFRPAASSLMEARTVNYMRQLAKGAHHVHSLLYFLWTELIRNIWLCGDGLLKGVQPGKKAGQSWNTTVWAAVSLLVVSQTEEGPVSIRGVDVVAVCLDLFSEGAISSAVCLLEKIRDIQMWA